MKHATFTTTRASRRLSEMDFAGWVGAAAPGDRLEYHRGFLAVDTIPMISKLPETDRATLKQTCRPRLVGRRAASRAPRPGAARPRPLSRTSPSPGRSRSAPRCRSRRCLSMPKPPERALTPIPSNLTKRTPECRFRRIVPSCRTCLT